MHLAAAEVSAVESAPPEALLLFMIIATHVPSPPLQEFVAAMWFHEGLNAGYPLERVLPDGSMELIINLRDETRHTFDRTSHRPRESFRRSWLSGPHSEYLIIDTAPNASMIGVHFRPGGAGAFFKLPLCELKNRVFELESFWGNEASHLRERLLGAPNASAKFQVLEESLLQHWRDGTHHAAVHYALGRFTKTPHEITVGEITDATGVSTRRFIELFTKQIGMTPKVFCRVRRFRRALDQIAQSESLRWAHLANDCGYYDQAHFINEFREFTGLTPGEYVQSGPVYPGFVPVPAG